MKVALASLVMLLAGILNASAQADLRIYLLEHLWTEELRYDIQYEFVVRDRGEAYLQYSKRYLIFGNRVAPFTYTEEVYEGAFSRKALEATKAVVRQWKLEEPPVLFQKERSRLSGSVEVDGKRHSISLRYDSQAGKELRRAYSALLEEHLPVLSRRRITHTTEADQSAARGVDFETLLRAPQRYNGKRVCLTGFYRHEFEGSRFAPTRDDLENSARILWIGYESEFVPPLKLVRFSNMEITLEGTFQYGSAGHGGQYLGEITRITFVKEAEPTAP